MPQVRTLALTLTLAACDSGELTVGDGTDDTQTSDEPAPLPDTSTDPAPVEAPPTPDPDVDSYVPTDWTVPTASRVVFLGDSITAGSGASKGRLAYRRLLTDNDDATWPDAADLDLPALLGDDLEILDESIGGATTDTLLRWQLPNLAETLGDTPPKGETIVIVTIGGNDAQSALFPWSDTEKVIGDALANVETLLDWLQDDERFPDGTRIYLTNIYEPSDGIGTSRCFLGADYRDKLPALVDYNDTLYDMGVDRGVAILDLRGHFSGHGFKRANPDVDGHDPDDTTLWFANDCIHPNDRGHHEVRRLFWHALAGEDLPAPDPGE